METRGKRIFAQLGTVLLALVLLCAFALPAAAAETEEIAACFEHGDVNSDGRVNSKDAIYTLYHSIFMDAPEYAVDQDCDFNHDGLVDRQDAIYVLYSTFGIFEDYALEGTVHCYYEPLWWWNNDGFARAVFNCSCGQSVTLTSDDAVAVEVLSETELTCTENGVVEFAAAVMFNGQEYTSAHTAVTYAQGHSMNGEQNCTESSVCETCGFTLETLGHSWVLDEENSTEATCLQQAVRIYICETCGKSYTQTLEGFAEHSFVYLEDRPDPENPTCIRQPVYVCACGAEELGEAYAQHVYKAALTQEATCCLQGVMTYTCESCADTYEVTVETVADAHTWAVESGDETYTHYRCEGCGEVKKTVNTESGADVSTELLSDSQLQLDEITLELDGDTLAGLGDSVAVSVTTADVSGILDQEALDQIGSNPVYDFSMVTTYDDGQISEEVSSFGGQVTVSLPYTMQDGDDPECIDVWFIDDEGNVEVVQGSYANGYVKFTTDHFSYYTVTRLTPAQRCEQYGHNMVYHYREATCTDDGYQKEFCLRCGLVEVDEILPKLEHNYEDLGTSATCVKDGILKRKCERCKHQITGTIPAWGHTWVLDEEASCEASCKQSGKNVYICTNDGCAESYTETLPQLDHSMKLVEDKKNSCNGKGWKLYRCEFCGYEVKEKETAPHGHYYDPADATIEWSEDYSSATVTLICSHDKSTVSAHTRVLKAVVSHKTENATCQQAGRVIHTAEVSYNKQDFSFTAEETVPVAEHNTGDWLWNKEEHYRHCADCGQDVYHGDHNWTGEVVTQQPSCVTPGSATVQCGICGYETQKVLPAQGKHNYVNGKCTGCGREQGDCNHVARHEVPVDLSAYGICKGANIVWLQCDCGQERELVIKGLACWMAGSGSERTDENGITYWWNSYTCNQCGLTIDDGDHPVLNTQTCEINWQYGIILMKDGETLLEEYKDSGIRSYHQYIRYGEWVDLGLPCGERVRMGTCYCGENTGLENEVLCDWVKDPALSVGDTQVWNCANCGAVQTVVSTPISAAGACMTRVHNVYTFTWNGQVVYTDEADAVWVQHDYQVTNVLMAGDSCTDGIRADYVCNGCGEERTEYYGRHVQIYEEEIPLGEGFCMDHVILAKCPCGQEQDYYPVEGCNLVNTEVNSDWDFTRVCTNCGLTIEHETVWTGKDAQCMNRADQTVTFKDRNGNTVQTLHAYWSMDQHNEIQEYVLLGEKCTDGLDIVNSCADCGTEFNRFTNYQHVRTAELVDLSQYGFCGQLYLYKCPCGDYTHYNIEGGCQWVYQDRNWYHEVKTCRNCNITVSTQRTEPAILPGETCVGWQDVEVTVSRDGEILKEFAYGTLTEHHTSVVCQLKLLPGAEDCTGGYQVWRSCADCGVKFNNGQPETQYGHENYCVKLEETGVEGLCGRLRIGTYACACGRESWTGENWSGGECDFNYNNEYYLDNEDAWATDCTKCGATRVRTWQRLEDDDPCYDTVIQTFSYRKDGKELCSYERTSRNENHENCVWSFNMQGTECEDGYYVTGFCHTCGSVVVDDYLYTDCRTWLTGYEVLVSDENICGDWVLRTYSSPCGNQGNTRLDVACDTEYIGSDENGNKQHQCRNCDLIWTYQPMGSEKVGCREYDYSLSRYSLNGVLLSEKYICEFFSNHSMVYTFEMQGKTCQDGYYAYGTCVTCGTTRREGQYSNCYTFAVSRECLVSADNACGEIILVKERCACGEYQNEKIWENGCSFYYDDYDYQREMERYVCGVCGLVKYQSVKSNLIPDECKMKNDIHVIYSREGTILAEKTYSQYYTSHDYRYRFKMLGETCDDGYRVEQYCVNCDDGWLIQETFTGHETYMLEGYDLSEYGTCGGYAYHYGCACGRESYWDYWDYCYWRATGNTDDDGLWEYYCENCGSYRYFDSDGTFDRQNCATVGVFAIKLVKDGETKLDIRSDTRQSEHTMLLDSYILSDEETGCIGGFTVTEKCKYCGMTETTSDDGYHRWFTTEFVEMKELYAGACDGWVELRGCPCGESSNITWKSACLGCVSDSEMRYTCQNGKCDLVLLEDYGYTEDPEHCQRIQYETITLFRNEMVLKEWSTYSYREDHDYEVISSHLMSGAQSCDDGVCFVEKCTRCGDERTYNHYGHALHVAESIDLKPYGAVCDTTLDLYRCACGQNQRYDLAGKDGCDMEQTGTTCEIAGVIRSSQRQALGTQYFNVYAGVMTCAVTNPEQCHMKLRVFEYWLPVDGCVAAEFQTWQLGYNEATGTWMKELTIATGEQRTYHNVPNEDVSEERNGEYIWGTRYTCPDCGSYASELYYRSDDQDSYYLNEDIAVNMLDNGERRRYCYRNEYGWIEDYRVELLRRWEYVAADGTEEWSQYVYEYGQPFCYYTQTYSSSSGYSYTSEYTTHRHVNYTTETIREVTCTQFGESCYSGVCLICKQPIDGYCYGVSPTCHDWYWDYDREIYYCYDCGLENTNGASGQIVMEDMTEDYGNGENYVVGYWNRGGVSVEAYVSVILDEMDNDNEYVLSGIDFIVMDAEEDGITAYAFSQADAIDAARMTMEELGYDGSYAIRFSFVPPTGETTLDYAITFDSLAA